MPRDERSTDTLVLGNARLILPDGEVTGHVAVRDGIIADIGTGSALPAGAVDCEGHYLAAGLVELHTDNLERHLMPRPKVRWPEGAAIVAHDAELAGAGITTVFDAIRVGSIVSNGQGGYRRYARGMADGINAMRQSGALRIDHLLHLRAETCSETLLEELDEFDAADGIGIVSLMDHTPGQRQFTDVAKFEAYIRGKHGMSKEQFDDYVLFLSGLYDRVGREHEAATVAAAARFGAVIASHDDTTEAQVDISRGYGVRIAEFPTTVAAARACRAAEIAVIMGAPNVIRGGSHSGNVSAVDLAEAGLLDILSSDYVPAALLAAALQLGDLWGNLPAGLATVSRAPARSTGLGDRGEIAPGLRADFVRFRRVGDVPVTSGTWVRGRRVA